MRQGGGSPNPCQRAHLFVLRRLVVVGRPLHRDGGAGGRPGAGWPPGTPAPGRPRATHATQPPNARPTPHCDTRGPAKRAHQEEGGGALWRHSGGYAVAVAGAFFFKQTHGKRGGGGWHGGRGCAAGKGYRRGKEADWERLPTGKILPGETLDKSVKNAGKNSGLQPKTARKNIGRKSLVNPFFREMQASSHQIVRFS